MMCLSMRRIIRDGMIIHRRKGMRLHLGLGMLCFAFTTTLLSLEEWVTKDKFSAIFGFSTS